MWRYMLLNYSSKAGFTNFIEKCCEVDQIEEFSYLQGVRDISSKPSIGSNLASFFGSKKDEYESSIRGLLLGSVQNSMQVFNIVQLHNWLSSCYGVKVGLALDKIGREKMMTIYKGLNLKEEEECKLQEPILTLDNLLTQLEQKQELQKINHREIFLSFLMAKDDNMILLMSGLISRIQQMPELWRDSPWVSDFFGLTSIDETWKQLSKQEKALATRNPEICPSLIENILKIFEIQPQYFRWFTLQHCVNLINDFYVQDQRNQIIVTEPQHLNQPNFWSEPIRYGQTIPKSLLETYVPFLKTLNQIYSSQLKDIKYLLDDTRQYMMNHYLQDNERGALQYHNWFFYENLMHSLGEANQTLLNK